MQSRKPLDRTKQRARDDLEFFELAELARKAGCDVLKTSTVDEYGRTWQVLELDCHDNEHAIAFLNLAGKRDAWSPEIREIAAAILRAHPDDFAAGVQAFVKRNVKYVRENDEEFQSALLTLQAGEGDCDKQARCVEAICIAGGILDARIMGIKNRKGDIVHVCAQVPDAAIVGGWAWLETTIDANYGEAPIDAGVRLGIIKRKDVA